MKSLILFTLIIFASCTKVYYVFPKQEGINFKSGGTLTPFYGHVPSITPNDLILPYHPQPYFRDNMPNAYPPEFNKDSTLFIGKGVILGTTLRVCTDSVLRINKN